MLYNSLKIENLNHIFRKFWGKSIIDLAYVYYAYLIFKKMFYSFFNLCILNNI